MHVIIGFYVFSALGNMFVFARKWKVFGVWVEIDIAVLWGIAVSWLVLGISIFVRDGMIVWKLGEC